ncbi:transposase [Salinibacter ruber]|uniref:transposase n=1 Tax=Salinibacter ruber TaxID=146919 RepID=UPI002342F6EC
MARRRRYELTDEQFERIEEALPEVDGRGRPYEDHRKVVNGIFRVDGSGAPWRDLPERYGSWWAAHDRFRRWAEDGTLQSAARKLQGELDAEGRIDWEQLGAHSTTVRASRSAAGGPWALKRGPNRPRRRRSKSCSRI